MINASRLVIALFALGLAGCSLEPTYKRPEVAIPDTYKEAGIWQQGTPSDRAPRGDWWHKFDDADLDALEGHVEKSSPDLAAAVARYQVYASYAAEANAKLFPEVSGLASATRNRQSDNRPLRGPNQPDDYNAYTLGIGADYEIDLWGRVRSEVEASKALADAGAADLESVRLSLRSELAKAYFLLRGLDAQIKLLEDTAKDYKQQMEMMDRRHQEGIASGLDVSRAKTQIDEILAKIENFRARRAIYEHAIAVLIGEQPSNFSIAPAIVKIDVPDVPLGVPSTLLQRRPDIASAERRVAAANAQIGIARAAFFPTIDLGLAAGYQSTMGGGLLTAPNTFWSIGPAALLTLFDAGRREAVVERAKAQTDEAAAQYRATVLRAFAEVEDNLALLRLQQKEMTNQNAAAAAADHTFNLATNRYREGVVSYLEVVDADAARLRTQSASLDVETRQLLASVGLIRALGGGWQEARIGDRKAVSSPAANSASPPNATLSSR